MKRTLATLIGCTILGTASLAFADHPSFMGDARRAHFLGQLIVQKSQSLIDHAGSFRRGGWQRNALARESLRSLNLAAHKLFRLRPNASARRFWSAIRAVQARFHEAQRFFAWLRPSPFVQAEIAALTSGVAELGAVGQRLVAGYPMVMPQLRVTSAPLPPPPAPVTYAPPTTVYTTPGARVSIYQAR